MNKALTFQLASIEDAATLADIVRASYAGVANDFKLTRENCPKHPSNCTIDWIKNDLDRGVSYTILFHDKTAVGCAAVEQASKDVCYLERLAVLPRFRHNSFGKTLVTHCIKTARIYKAITLGIGIIDEQEILKQWYKTLGFKMTGTKRFDHLPFTVGFMEMAL